MIKITYTVKNDLTNDGRNFNADITLYSERKAFFEMMRDAAKLDPQFE